MPPTSIAVSAIAVVVAGVVVVLLLRKFSSRIPEAREWLKLNHAMVRATVPKLVITSWMVSLALVSGLTLALQGADRVLAKNTWPEVHEPGLQLGFGLALAAMAFIESLRRGLRRLTAKNDADMRADVLSQLGAVIGAVCEIQDVKPSQLGSGLFLVRKSRLPGRSDILVRPEKQRLLSYKGSSGVVFTMGAGVVGQCWETRRPKHYSWTAVNRRFAAGEPTRDQWEDLSDEEKHGLRYEDWRVMLGRYSEVVAVPVVDKSGTVRGCLALDRQWNRDKVDTADCLSGADVEAQLDGIAQVLSAVLKV